MNGDQIAEIRPAIREAIEGAPNTCVTLEVEGSLNKWMQVVDHTINAAYPHNDAPQQLINWPHRQISAKLVKWVPGKLATFEIGELEASTISHWIDAYFVNVLGCPPGEYHLSVAFERL